jgi:hypothetical protein
MIPRFYLRPSKNLKGLRQLLIIYSNSDNYYKVNAGIPRITEKQWDQANSRIVDHSDAAKLTLLIQKNMLTMETIVNNYKWNNNGNYPSIEHVRTEYEKPHEETIKMESLEKEKELDKSNDILYNYDIFLNEKMTKNRAPAHYKLLGDNLNEFLKGQKLLVQDIDKQFLKDFLNFYIAKKKLARKKLTDKPFDNKTINRRIKFFKTFLRWMEIDKERDVNPAYKNFETDLVETEKKIIFLDDKEFKKTVRLKSILHFQRNLNMCETFI